jgi:C4-dicarboxylate-specific signal transduction histidine kinase
MGQLTASIAHEVKQPLAAIVTNAGAGLRWLSRSTPDLDEVRGSLKNIVDAGHRANEVINGIRAMFEKGVRNRGAVDVNQLIRDVLTLVQGDLKTKRVTSRVELLAGMPPILADRVQIQQVILNLIVNAIDAMSLVYDRERVLEVSSRMLNLDGILMTVNASSIHFLRPNPTAWGWAYRFAKR